MRIILKYASRGRPEWFKKAIENIQSTISTDNYLILVSLDEDDSTMANDEIRKFLLEKNHIAVIYDKSDSKVQAINRDLKYLENIDLLNPDRFGKPLSYFEPKKVDWQLLINMSDDMTFTVNGWDKIMIEKIKSVWGDSTDFFAHFNDGYTKDALSTMSIMGRTYYERDGYIYHPSYKSFSCDAEAFYVARLRGCHHYFEDVLFLHQHPNQSPTPNDETYYRNSLHTDHDTKNYFERLNRNFDTGFVGVTEFDQHKTI